MSAYEWNKNADFTSNKELNAKQFLEYDKVFFPCEQFLLFVKTLHKLIEVGPVVIPTWALKWDSSEKNGVQEEEARKSLQYELQFMLLQIAEQYLWGKSEFSIVMMSNECRHFINDVK